MRKIRMVQGCTECIELQTELRLWQKVKDFSEKLPPCRADEEGMTCAEMRGSGFPPFPFLATFPIPSGINRQALVTKSRTNGQVCLYQNQSQIQHLSAVSEPKWNYFWQPAAVYELRVNLFPSLSLHPSSTSRAIWPRYLAANIVLETTTEDDQQLLQNCCKIRKLKYFTSSMRCL